MIPLKALWWLTNRTVTKDTNIPQFRRFSGAHEVSGGEVVEALDGEGAAFLVVYGSTAMAASPNINHCCFVRPVLVVCYVQLEARSRLVLVAHGVTGSRWRPGLIGIVSRREVVAGESQGEEGDDSIQER